MAASSVVDASAADWYTGRGNAPASAYPATTVKEVPADDNWIVAVDASISGTSKNSLFGDLVGTFAAMGTLKTSGARIRVDALTGNYSYDTASKVKVESHQQAGSAMVGYEWIGRNTTAAVYVGAAAQSVSLSIPDPANSVVGTGVGLKVSGEFYSRPTANTMVSGYASYSTLHSAYYSRLKYGWAVLDDTFVGPEVSFLGDALYRQIRAGVHITGFRVGNLQFGVSGGFLKDMKQGSGAYGILDARIGF